MTRLAKTPANHASALLTRLVLQGLAAENPALLPADLGPLPDALRQAHVDAGLKRRLLEHALAQSDAATLIRAGRGICRQGFAPPLAVLLRAADMAGLVQQWMRLERYFHARNRTRLTLTGNTTLLAERWGLNGQVPARAENLLIQGLLWGLLERFGAQPVRLLAEPDDATWHYTWQDVQRPAATASISPQLAEAAPLPVGAAGQKLARFLGCEPARAWRLQQAAEALRQSPRGLQRTLAAEGTSFQGLLRGLRIREACLLLLHEDWSLAEIGYACGFADQAHFQRQFRAATNFTPGDYRTLGQTGVNPQ